MRLRDRRRMGLGGIPPVEAEDPVGSWMGGGDREAAFDDPAAPAVAAGLAAAAAAAVGRAAGCGGSPTAAPEARNRSTMAFNNSCSDCNSCAVCCCNSSTALVRDNPV